MYRLIRLVLTCFWLVFFGHLLVGLLPELYGAWVNTAAVVMAALHLVEMWFFRSRIQSSTNPKLEALYIFLFGIAQGLDPQNKQ